MIYLKYLSVRLEPQVTEPVTRTMLAAPLILVIICLHPTLTQVQVGSINCQSNRHENSICIQISENSNEDRQAAAVDSGGVTLTTFASITFLLQLVTLLVSK